MKKLFFLCAATALLAACSSDGVSEMIEGTEGVAPSVESEYPSAGAVEFTNGTAMYVGALDESGKPLTRSTNGTVGFCIDLGKFNDVLKGFGDYKLLADDFAIRRDGEYVENLKIVDNTVNKFKIQLSEEDLKISVENLQNLNFNKADNYTFETYLWIENKKLLNDGTGSYGELFTDEDKADWIAVENWPVAEGEETGVDLSERLWNKDGAYFTSGSADKGLLVKYNVYRGLQGRNGDTPYIKVSISVEKPEKTTVGDEEKSKNECTWVGTPTAEQ